MPISSTLDFNSRSYLFLGMVPLDVILVYGRQLPTYGLQSEAESAIHERDSNNIGPGTARLKAEVPILQKSGSF